MYIYINFGNRHLRAIQPNKMNGEEKEKDRKNTCIFIGMQKSQQLNGVLVELCTIDEQWKP